MEHVNTLLVFVDPAQYVKPKESASVRGLVNFCKNALVHYRGKGLRVAVVDATRKADDNFKYDAALGEVPLVKDGEAKKLTEKYNIHVFPSLVLTSGTGEAAWVCDTIPRAYTLAFAIEGLLGEPDYRADHTNKETLPYFDHQFEETVDSHVYSYDKKTSGESGVYYVNTQADFDAYKNKTFNPGDTVYFARGCTFEGMFAPAGGGTAEKPVSLLSYGLGPRPLINAKREPGGIVLFNTQGWEIDGINITNGRYWGIFVGSDSEEPKELSHFVIRNCSVSKTGNEWPSKKNDAYSGPVCFNVYDTRTGKSGNAQFNDIVIDNCETYDTTRGEGIYIGGAFDKRRSDNILIQNCFIHNTGFDGLLVMCGSNVIIKDNVAFHTGTSPVNVGYSPNSVWIWRCTDALLSGNECSFAHSPVHNTDGGAFDVDFYCKNTTHEYNYAHDNDTYGISVFGAGYHENMPKPDDHITANSIVRKNYFGNNQVVGWGEVYFLTWNGGLVDGFEFYDNFIYSNPKDGVQPAITFPDVNYTGEQPRIFRDNVIYSSTGFFMNMKSTDGVVFENNYYYSDADALKWHWANDDYTSLADFALKTGQEKNGYFSTTKPKPDILK
jgi:hypothetical protein